MVISKSATLTFFVLITCGCQGSNSGSIAPQINDLSSSSSSEVIPQVPGGDATQFFQIVAKSNQEARAAKVTGYTTLELQKALHRSALIIVNRNPTSEELSQATSFENYKGLVASYLNSSAFMNRMTAYFRAMFEMAGTSGGINYDEPANLALLLFRDDVDFRQILTADFCVDNSLNKVACSSFRNPSDQAAHAAGAITTRGFMQKWTAPFNFRRVSKVFQVFTCQDYPDDSDPGLPVDKISGTVKTFNATTGSPVCYECHRSMNPRTVLFYDFDRNGFFNLAPTGTEVAQTDTGAASTKADLVKAGTPSVYHGIEMNSVRAYGQLLSRNRKFRDCMAKRLVNLMLGNENPRAAIPKEYDYLAEELSWGGFKMKSAMLDIALNPAFIKR